MLFWGYFLHLLEGFFAYSIFFRLSGEIETSFKVIYPFCVNLLVIDLKLSLFLTFYFVVIRFIGVGLWLFSKGEKFENAIREALNFSIKGLIKVYFYLSMGTSVLFFVLIFFNFQIPLSNPNVTNKVSELKQKFELSQLVEKMNKSCTRCNGDGQVDQADIIRLNKENEWQPGKCNQCQGK